VGDVLNYAMIRLYRDVPEIEFMLQIHDAFVIQCTNHSSVIQARIGQIREAFNIPISICGRELVIPIEIKVGDNWEDMEKI